MKTFVLGVCMMGGLAGCASPSGEALVHEAMLVSSPRVAIREVDGNSFVRADRTPVKPGLHGVDLTTFSPGCIGGDCLRHLGVVTCRTQAGYEYLVDRQGCTVRYSASKQAAVLHYQTYKHDLDQPQTNDYLWLMQRDIQKYLPPDPAHLLVKIQQQLADNRDAAQHQHVAHAMAVREEIITFQKQLKAGQTSNCGLVVTVKPDVVLVQSSHGQLWVKRHDLYPPQYGYACRYGG